MAQWGKSREFVLPDGAVMTVVPHVDTGENPFAPIGNNSTIDLLLLTNFTPRNIEFLEKLKAKFVGRPYLEWARAPEAVS